MVNQFLGRNFPGSVLRVEGANLFGESEAVAIGPRAGFEKKAFAFPSRLKKESPDGANSLFVIHPHLPACPLPRTKRISSPLAYFSGHIRSVNPSQPMKLRKGLLLFLAVPERILKQ